MSYFTINSTIQAISINANLVSGYGGIEGYYLNIPFKIALRPHLKHNNETVKFILLTIDAYLAIPGIGRLETQGRLICDWEVRSEREQSDSLYFPLNDKQIFLIEESRKANLIISIEFTFHYGIFSNVKIQNNQGEFFPDFISTFENKNCNIHLEILHSHWVTKVLPGMGYKNFKMIEIPLASKLIPNEFAKSIIELEAAEMYFANGDYDKTVAHCRAALDPFKDIIKKLKDNIKSKSEVAWMSETMESTIEWLYKMIKSTSGVSNKTHHPPSMGHFDRKKAEIIYLITVSIVAYFGKIDGEIKATE